MKSVLVLGKNGQLGKALEQINRSDSWEFLGREEADLSHHQSLRQTLESKEFDILINAAAYTAVDLAEDEEEKANAINAEALNIISKICLNKNALLIHISTDYVFGKVEPLPTTESHPTNPTSVYGKSKLQGELNIQNCMDNFIILRTAWLYGSEGHNFLNTMLRFGKERDELSVVYDQVGSPTLVNDLAEAIIHIVNLPAEKQTAGIYHYSNEGVCSWYDFALAIFDIAKMTTTVQPVLSDAFPVKAVRPPYSVLNKKKIKDTFGIQISHWRKALHQCVNQMNLTHD